MHQNLDVSGTEHLMDVIWEHLIYLGLIQVVPDMGKGPDVQKLSTEFF